MKYVKLFSYTGNKIKYLDIIKEHLPASYTRFIEPFCGSAVVSLNLADTNKEVVINDLNKDTIRIFQEEAKYENVIDLFKNNDKKLYISICEKEKPTVEELIYYANNSFFCGFKHNKNKKLKNSYRKTNTYTTSKEDFSIIKEKLSNFTILNKDYRDLDYKAGDFIFLDPPYTETLDKNSQYNHRTIVDENFLNHLNSLGCKFMLFDSVKYDDLNCVEIKYKVSSSGKVRENTHYMITNY